MPSHPLRPRPAAESRPSGLVVLAVGMLTLDVVHVVDRLPRPDEKIWSRAQHLAFGGPAANAAATAAALGASSRLLAPFGASPATALVAGMLATAGVDWVDPLPDTPHPSPVSTVLVTAGTGERAVIAGGAPPLPDPRSADGVVIDEQRIVGLLDGVGAVLVDGHAHPWALATARQARARGIPVLLDGGSHKPGTALLLEHVDLAILSADFRAPGGADPLAWVLAHQRGPRRYAARSAGAGPLRWRAELRADGAQSSAESSTEKSTEGSVPVAVVDVVDTLGAGDVLHGAAAVALARLGLGTGAAGTLEQVLGFAAGVATLSCRYTGALGWAAPASRPGAARAQIDALSTEFLDRASDRG